MGVVLGVALSLDVNEQLWASAKAEIIQRVPGVDDVDSFPLDQLDNNMTGEAFTTVRGALQSSCRGEGRAIHLIIGGNQATIIAIKRSTDLIAANYPRPSVLGIVSLVECSPNAAEGRLAGEVLLRFSDNGMPRPEHDTEFIHEVTSVNVEQLDNPARLHIVAQGFATSTGWTDPVLESQDQTAPPDGIFMYHFEAKPSVSPGTVEQMPLVASLVQPLPSGLKGVRVRAERNEVLDLLEPTQIPLHMNSLTSVSLLTNPRLISALQNIYNGLHINLNPVRDYMNALENNMAAAIAAIGNSNVRLDLLLGGNEQIHQNLKELRYLLEGPIIVWPGIIASIPISAKAPAQVKQVLDVLKQQG